MNGDPNLDLLLRLYEENGRVAAAFWEWRHKVMTYLFTGVAGIAVATGWLYFQPGLKNWAAGPPVLGALLCLSLGARPTL